MPSYILMPSMENILPDHTVMSSRYDGTGQAIYNGWWVADNVIYTDWKTTSEEKTE